MLATRARDDHARHGMKEAWENRNSQPLVPSASGSKRINASRPLDAVLRRRLVHEPAIEPAPNVLLVLHAARRGSAARELVTLAGEADHDRRLSLLLEGAEHRLTLADRRAPVLFAVDHHQWRGDAGSERDRRALAVLLGVFERGLPEPERREHREVGAVIDAGPVGHAALRHRGLEAVTLNDEPVRQQASTASARDAEPFRVHTAARDQRIDTGQEVLGVLFGTPVLEA